MADLKITQLTEDTSLVAGDMLPVVTDIATTAVTKKASLTTLAQGVESVFNAPEGFLINGKIVPSVTSNNISISIKGMDGNDPSATNPVYVRINNTVRSITAALGTTVNAGGNYLNMGSAELATKEVDLFVYLVYSSANTIVAMAVSRIPYATVLGDMTWSNTAEKGLLNSSNVTNVATDDVVNIGRFAATLSAGAGYTWTVPTFTSTNLIQRPIYITRWLSYTPVTYGTTGTLGSYAATNQTGRYMLDNNTLRVRADWNHSNVGSWTGETRHQLPFGVSATEAARIQNVHVAVIWSTATLAIEAGVYSITTGGLIRFVNSINTSFHAYSSLNVADWFSINATLEAA